MVPIWSVSFVVRPRRGLLLLVPAVVMAAGLGCGHKRSAMRPVYVTPAPAVAAPCPSTAAPVVTEPALSAPTPSEATIPMIDPSAAPASTPPARSSLPDEPGLEQIPSAEVPKASPSAPPRLQGPAGPTSSLRNGRRESGGRLRQASLRQRVLPLVNDPDDLFSPPKADRPWKYVVLHHSAKPSGNYDEIDREHRKVLGWEGCGYHFVIGNGSGSPDGRIEVARRWSEQKQGVHCRNGKDAEVNEYGIGICLVGDLEQSPPTPRQVASARALVAYLSDRYQIPVSRVETHAHLASTPTVCPGRLFPAQAILGQGGLAQR
jgi:hypothetical protein